ncbi:MAG: flagellar hook-length control protein FliK [Aliarcobacter sp.]|nr:flagellar hook-length control protein FliK [Aliarcobacter sp.]
MANSIDILKDTKTATSTSSAKLPENQAVKEKPSLFDSLLVSNKEEQIAESSTSTIAIKTVPNPEIEDSQTEVSTQENDSKLKTTGSLLDRMILEVKKEIKNSNQEEVKNPLDKTNLKILNNSEATETIKTVENEEEIKSKPELIVNNENKKENSNQKPIISNTEEKIKDKKTELIDNEEKIIKVESVEIKENQNLLVSKTEDPKLEIENKDNIENKTEEKTIKINPSLEETITDLNKNDKTLDKKTSAEALITSETTVKKEEVKVKNSEVTDKEKITENVTVVKTTVSLEDALIENLKNINQKETISTNTKEIDKTLITEIILPEEQVKIAPEQTANIKTNIAIDTTIDEKLNVLNTALPSNSDTKLSLMDQLILKNSMNQDTIMPLGKVNIVQDENISKDIISNIYLSSQKNSISNQELFNKSEAINLLKDAKSLNDVKTSAGMLDLGLENVDVDVEQNIELASKVELNRKTDNDLLIRKNLLNNLILEKNIRNEDVKVLITQSVEASKALMNNTLVLAEDAIVTVNSPLSYNIQSKIIGARQQMSTMMSDIAKQMYENYKPPVTVFRINLNPLELGSIAILMKSDKNNALSISMNVSNNGTLDALMENQNILRNSLNKTFEENTKFNLDFTSSNQDNNQSNKQNSQDNQNNSNQFDQKMDTQSVLQLKEENKDREEKSIDYM